MKLFLNLMLFWCIFSHDQYQYQWCGNNIVQQIQSDHIHRSGVDINVKCGDFKTDDVIQCDDGNMQPFDGCFNCKFQCHFGCQDCICGECINCKNGWEYNTSSKQCLLTVLNQPQHIISNNYLTVFHEYKENYYYSYYFNEFISYYPFCQNCLFFVNDQCLKCLEGWQLDIITQICIKNPENKQISMIINNQMNQIWLFKSFQFINECIQLTNSLEQCNIIENQLYWNYILDKILLQQLAIYSSECPDQCEYCYQYQCMICKKGYSLYKNQCVSQCGDLILNPENEQCDTDLQGCQECQIQQSYKCLQVNYDICWTCEKTCQSCQLVKNDLVCLLCEDGYYIEKDTCLPCDDNCVTCVQYSFMCTQCYRDDCDFCENYQGLYTDKKLKKCTSICGDGVIYKIDEQCDDGNLDNLDGCDDTCKLENQDTVQTLLFSVVDQKDSLYNPIDKNDIVIYHIDGIELNCSSSSISILFFTDQNYNYTTQLLESQDCYIHLIFYQSIYEYNTITFQIGYFSTDNRLLSEQRLYQAQIQPKVQEFLNNNQQSQVQSISNAQTNFYYYLFWLIGPLSMIFGVFDYFWQILDLLSWINNFYYFNVNYPFNLETFFQKSDWSLLITFPSYQGLNQPGCEYYVQSPTRFNDKNIDPLFINNIQTPFLFILLSLTIYILIVIIQYLINLYINKIYNNRKAQLKKKYIVSVQVSIFKISTRLNKPFEQKPRQYEFKEIDFINQETYLQKKIKEIKNASYQKVKQTSSLFLMDIVLAITLQLIYANNFKYSVILINEFLAIISIIFVWYQLMECYQTVRMNKILQYCPQFKNKYGCYFDKINVTSKYGTLFNFIYLIKKILIIFFTAFYYYSPLLQTSLCFIVSMSCVLIMIYENPFEERHDYRMTIMTEFCVSALIFSTVILAINDQHQIITQKDQFGWIMICLIVAILVLQVSDLLFQISTLIFYKIKQYLKVNNGKQQDNK